MAHDDVTIGSLFSGIGALDLGVQQALPTARHSWMCELDPWRRRVLERHWPEVPKYADVTALDAPPVSMIVGGFPCRTVSTAGKKQGIDASLWPAYAGVVERLRPTWVFIENVRGLWTRGLDRVERDLSGYGYETHAGTFPAWAVGAPHYSDRTFVLGRRTNAGGKPRLPINDETPELPKPGSSFWSAHPCPPRVDARPSRRVDRRRIEACGDACPPQQAAAALTALAPRAGWVGA